MLIDRGEHVLSELLLLPHARCERPECACTARMDQPQQRCKQQRPLRSHCSTVQLRVTSGDMMSAMATWLDGPDGGASERTSEGAVLRCLGARRKFEVFLNAFPQLVTMVRTATPPRDAVPPFSLRPIISTRRVVASPGAHCNLAIPIWAARAGAHGAVRPVREIRPTQLAFSCAMVRA